MQQSRKILKIILIIVTALILIFGSLGVWLGRGSLTEAKMKVFEVVPYPLALVNGRPILMRDFILRLKASQKMAENKIIPSPATKNDIYNTMVLEEEIRQIAAFRGVFVGRKQIEQEFADRAGEPEFVETLKNYGFSEANFKNEILQPQLLLVNLKVWFCGQKELNAKAYNLAQAIVEKEALGDNFGNLAESFSQESGSKQLGGDLGFVQPTELLLELREPVELLKDGEVKILPSRLGLHIIKQEAQAGSEKHLRQIFLQTENFDSWLSGQTQNFNVKKLVNINN